jgi:nicotinate-nucleotide adenylyltransferase
MKRIGLFGGTFNPIHMGHLVLAECARDQLALDEVIFIPNRMPPHKAEPGYAPEWRLKLVSEAIRDIEGFMVSDIELDRDKASYTVDTLREIHATWPEADLIFLIGADSLFQLEKWVDYQEIFRLTDFGVVARPPFDEDRCQLEIERLEGLYPIQFQWIRMPMMDISSSAIRTAARPRTEGGRFYDKKQAASDHGKKSKLQAGDPYPGGCGNRQGLGCPSRG